MRREAERFRQASCKLLRHGTTCFGGKFGTRIRFWRHKIAEYMRLRAPVSFNQCHVTTSSSSTSYATTHSDAVPSLARPFLPHLDDRTEHIIHHYSTTTNQKKVQASRTEQQRQREAPQFPLFHIYTTFRVAARDFNRKQPFLSTDCKQQQTQTQ